VKPARGGVKPVTGGAEPVIDLEERPAADRPPAAPPVPAAHRPSLPLALAVAGAVATAALVLFDAGTPLRPVVVLAFLLAGPGLGVARLLPGADPAARLAVSLAASLAIVALVAEAMLLLDAWSPVGGLAAVLALFALALGLARWRSQASPWPSRAWRRAVPGRSRAWLRAVPGRTRAWLDAAPGRTRALLRPLPAGSRAWVQATPGRTSAWLRTASGRAVAGHLACLLGALGLWLVAVSVLDLRRIGDYGLAPNLPVAYLLALAVLVGSFTVAVVRRRTPTAVLALHVVVLILMVHGTLAAAYDAPRYAWAYKHVGVVDYIVHHGRVDRSVDLYHNWPGGFALAALATQLAGAASPLPLVAWAQLGFSLLDLAALVFVFRSLARDRRLVWLGAFVFFAANWVGQEYFSPQALTFFLSLVLLGVCLRWLPGDPQAPAVPRQERVVAAGTVLGLFAVIAVSHQLTPWAVVAATAVLAALGRCRPRVLPLALAVLAAGWLWLAWPSLVDLHVLGDLGNLGRNGQVVDLSNQSEGRVFVATVARALSGLVWLLALVGGVRHWRSGPWRASRWGLVTAALALVPFSIVAAQSYGGEILFRVYLFSLPWTALLAAGAFFPVRGAARGRAGAVRTAAALTATGSVLVAGLLVAYFGLERANHLRPGEVAAARRFYQVAPPGSFLMLVASNFPTRLDARYPEHPGYGYDPSLLALPRFQDRLLGPADLDAVVYELGGYRDAYLMVSTSQADYAELFDLAPPGAVERLERALLASPRFRVVYRNADATLLRLRR
jgi:hypothetical protein